MAQKNAKMSFSDHAIMRFRERSGVPNVENMPEAHIRSVLYTLIQQGNQVVQFVERSGKRHAIIQISCRASSTETVLYAVMDRTKNRRTVITIYDEAQYQSWLRRHVQHHVRSRTDW